MYKQIKVLDHHIIAGEDALTVFKTLFESGDYKNRSFFILADDNTAKNCLPVLKKYIPQETNIPVCTIHSGEKNKTLEQAEFIWQFLSSHHADRNSVLINLGGGMITDLGGFAASVFKRGISFINIPTSLMGMVDAAIGGKTAVNLKTVKNSIGTFSQPDAIYIYPEFLDSLPKREVYSGYAEIIKYALINDSGLWEILKHKKPDDFQSMEDLVSFSMLIKAEIVEQDPKEQNIRKTLNFGHTFGHAFEALSSRRNKMLTHGEAIAAGMICEAYLSMKINELSNHNLEEIRKSILKNFTTPGFGSQDYEELIIFMQQDKKNQQDKINCSLLENIGKVRYDQLIPLPLIEEALNYLLND